MPAAPRHIDSFYRATAPEPAPFGELEGDHDADVAVVGGGLAGLTTARELVLAGRRVVLIESDRVGWAASGRNGGFVSPGYAEGIFEAEKRLGYPAAKALWDLSVEGQEYVRSTIAALGRPDLIQGHGWLKVWRHPARGAMLERVARVGRDYGLHYEVVEREALGELLTTDRYRHAIIDRNAFQIQPLAYAEALAADLAARGAGLYEGSPAVGLARRGDGWQVETPKGRVLAGHVVLAGNIGMGALYPKLARAILPVATYVAVTERLGARLGDFVRWTGAIADTRRAGDYYRIVDGDRLLWGGKITTRASVPANLADVMRRTIADVYPALADVGIAWAWAGQMGYAVHLMPIVREFAPGLVSATALGGHGLNTSAAVGKVVAGHILGTDDRMRLFDSYRALWGGGPVGRIATQVEYWRLQLMDRVEERRAAG